MLPSGASRDYPKLKAGFSIPSAPPMGNTNLLSTRTWERCGRLSKDVAQRFLVLEAEVRSPNTSSFHALLNLPFVATGQQWQRTGSKKRGTYVFKSNFLFSSGTWPVTGCRNVLRLSLWLQRKKRRESCHQLGVTTQRMAGHGRSCGSVPLQGQEDAGGWSRRETEA